MWTGLGLPLSVICQGDPLESDIVVMTIGIPLDDFQEP